MILAQAFPKIAIDLDGVMWRGDEVIAGAPETIVAVRSAGRRVCFVTNNSATPIVEVAARLTSIGAGDAPIDVVSSAEAAARLLVREVPGLRGRLTYVIGGEGLRQAVAATGARLASTDEGRQATLVVVGLDRNLSYEALQVATEAIAAGALFVASNADASYPGPTGPWPGAGAIAAALTTATGVSPKVAGKPEPDLLEVAADHLGGGPALMVGDRVETDVVAAANIGWSSALVLTGSTSVTGLASASAWPTFILRTLSDLVEDLPHARIRPASGPDLPSIATLLHAGGLVSGAARERVGKTLIAEVDRSVVGTAAFEVLGERGILRSVAVGEKVRRSGVGTALVAATLRRLRHEGVREVYLATDAAPKFFDLCGFKEATRGQIPDDVAEHPHLVRECAGATIMHAPI